MAAAIEEYALLGRSFVAAGHRSSFPARSSSQGHGLQGLRPAIVGFGTSRDKTMRQALVRWRGIVIIICLPNVTLASGNLVSVVWLGRNLGSDDILLIAASSTRLYAANHIPGATSVDLYRYGSPHQTPASEMERRLQSWGVSPEKHV